MDEQLKEKLVAVAAKAQQFSVYIAKQYRRASRDVSRTLNPQVGLVCMLVREDLVKCCAGGLVHRAALTRSLARRVPL